MSKQQTAVEWFAKQLYDKMEMKGDGNIFDKLLEQAKEMEKEQIIDARLSLDKSDNIWDSAIASEEAEKYYKETYE